MRFGCPAVRRGCDSPGPEPVKAILYTGSSLEAVRGEYQFFCWESSIWFGFKLGKFGKDILFFLLVIPWAVTGSHRCCSWRPRGRPFAQLGYHSCDCLKDLLLCVMEVHRQRLCYGVQRGKGIPTFWYIFCLKLVEKCKFWNFSQHRCLHLELEWWRNITAHGNCIINLSSSSILVMILKYFAEEKGCWLYPHFIDVEMKAKGEESI